MNIFPLESPVWSKGNIFDNPIIAQKRSFFSDTNDFMDTNQLQTPRTPKDNLINSIFCANGNAPFPPKSPTQNTSKPVNVKLDTQKEANQIRTSNFQAPISLLNSNSPKLSNFQIKPARKGQDCYIDNFPKQAFSHPYKYDIKITIPSNQLQNTEIDFQLRSVKTQEVVKKNHKQKESIEVEKKDEKSNKNLTTLVYRVVFNICSFHYQRSNFLFEVCLVDQSKNTTVVFQSTEFEMFARKTKTENWPQPNKKKRKPEMSLTLDASLLKRRKRSNSSKSIGKSI